MYRSGTLPHRQTGLSAFLTRDYAPGHGSGVGFLPVDEYGQTLPLPSGLDLTQGRVSVDWLFNGGNKGIQFQTVEIEKGKR
ncbi:MAG: hypothetical protein FJW39_31265 [Acidobacteria bacterium]|nr:hypothetical protein [Acidobacteriota bacterium]